MTLESEILYCTNSDELPSVERIKSISRGIELKVKFGKKLNLRREKIGENWKKELPFFQVGVHTFENEINISKLITDEEIIEHQLYFENCAKDYRILSEKLIFDLAKYLNVKIDPRLPLNTFNKFKGDESKQIGETNGWRYYLHGYHCGFTNLETGQNIESPLIFGYEFGELDPYFFSKFINSTPKYQPFPITIYHEFADGMRILEKMVGLNKFEVINSNFQDQSGIVVTDRKKIEIKIFKDDRIQNMETTPFKIQKLSIWKRILKKIKN